MKNKDLLKRAKAVHNANNPREALEAIRVVQSLCEAIEELEKEVKLLEDHLAHAKVVISHYLKGWFPLALKSKAKKILAEVWREGLK